MIILFLLLQYFICSIFFLKQILYIYLFIYFYDCVGSSFLCEGFFQLRRVGATLHRGARASHCRGLSLRSTGSRCAGSVVVVHGPNCSVACGIFPDQGSNRCPLHRQADSQPLCHQGSPICSILFLYLVAEISMGVLSNFLTKSNKIFLILHH